MSGTSTIFSGNSRYSSDFQSLIDRATNIASLPMMQMQNVRKTMDTRSSALSSLDSKVAAVQSAIANLATAAGSGSFSASVSDGSVLRSSISGDLQAGTYSIDVTNLGSTALTMSKAPGGSILTVSDPATQTLSPGSSFRLHLDGDTEGILITPSGNTLNSLVDAINAASPDVQATVVNVGGSSGTDYRLSIQGRDLQAHTIALKDESGTSLLDQFAPGHAVTYSINGGAVTSNDTRTITLAPGLKATLLKETSGTPATLTISRQASGVSSALNSLVSAYNSAIDELDSNRGQATGALSGDSLISTVTQTLRDVVGYSSGKDGLSSLAALGVSFDDKGKLSLDSSVFDAATSSQFDQLAAFLGSPTDGGFLKTATDAMSGLEDSTSGILKTSISSLATQMTDQDARIATEQERVDQVKSDMQSQMAAADALIASMEQQVNYITGLFEAMRTANSTGN